MGIQSELKIVWVRGSPVDFPYLREKLGLMLMRETRRHLRYLEENPEVVAYSIVSPPKHGDDVVSFRVWSFRTGRKRNDPYERGTPMEAVDPGSIMVGTASVSVCCDPDKCKHDTRNSLLGYRGTR
jgi:hypothetical protein